MKARYETIFNAMTETEAETYTAKEVAELIGGKPATVSKYLSEMAKEEIIVRTGKGLYSLPAPKKAKAKRKSKIGAKVGEFDVAAAPAKKAPAEGTKQRYYEPKNEEVAQFLTELLKMGYDARIGANTGIAVRGLGALTYIRHATDGNWRTTTNKEGKLGEIVESLYTSVGIPCYGPGRRDIHSSATMDKDQVLALLDTLSGAAAE